MFDRSWSSAAYTGQRQHRRQQPLDFGPNLPRKRLSDTALLLKNQAPRQGRTHFSLPLERRLKPLPKYEGFSDDVIKERMLDIQVECRLSDVV